MSDRLADEEIEEIRGRLDADPDMQINRSMLMAMSRTYITRLLDEVELLREERNRYRKGLSECLSLAREQCDPAVIGSLLAHIASTAREALKAGGDQ